jgi:rhomboid protease GluP
MGTVPVEPQNTPVSPQRSQFTLTTVLIAVNVAVFVFMAFSGVSISTPTNGQLIRWGANFGPLSLGTQPWRILTSNYVHIGLVHILLNMWCLWSLGRLAEQLFDPITYFLIYTICGISGSVASLWWHPEVIGAGASGAIFGLAGAVLAVLYIGRLPISRHAIQPVVKSLVAFVGYNLLFGAISAAASAAQPGAIPNIDSAAHLGGLIAGLCLGGVARFTTNRDQLRASARVTSLALAGLLSVSFLALRKSPAATNATALDNAITAIQTEQPQEAIRNLRIAIQQHPNQPVLHYLLGMQYLAVKQPDDAIAAFQQALELKPDFADAEQGLGTAYAAMGREDEAKEAFSKAEGMSHGGR